MEDRVVVVYDLYRAEGRMWASLALILPKDAVNYQLKKNYSGGEVEVASGDVVPVFLSAPMRNFVNISLEIQGKKPGDYVVPVTVHGPSKVRKNQGIIFVKKLRDIPLPLKYYNYPTRPCKSFPCDYEKDYRKIEEMIRTALNMATIYM